VNSQKIGFVGIAVKRGVALHGLALNVSPDLGFFQMIHSCGLKEVGITSMAELLGKTVPLSEIKARILFHFQKIFNMNLNQTTPDNLRELMHQYHDQ